MISPAEPRAAAQLTDEQQPPAQPIRDGEHLCRFVFSRQHFRRESMKAKPDAFLPSGDGETSVSRIDGLGDSEILALGAIARGARAESLKGYAILIASEVPRAKLQLKVDEPPQRHAVIHGWPELKDEQLLAAIDLAEASALSLVA